MEVLLVRRLHLRRRLRRARVVARGVKHDRGGEGQMLLVDGTRHVDVEAVVVVVAGGGPEHAFCDLEERDHLEVRQAVPLRDAPPVEEPLAHLLIPQLELERGERRAAMELVGLVHEQVGDILVEGGHDLAEAVPGAQVALGEQQQHRRARAHVLLELPDVLQVVDVQEDASVGKETLQLALDCGRNVLSGAPDVRVEEVVPLALTQRELGRIVSVTQQHLERGTLLPDVERERAEEEREDHQDREHQEHVDQLMRRVEAEDPGGLAVHAALLGARVHVLVRLDDDDADEGDHHHELRADGEVAVVVVEVWPAHDREREDGHANHEADQDAKEGEFEEEHPAGQEGPAHELHELPVEALGVVVAVQERNRPHEAVGRAGKDGSPR